MKVLITGGKSMLGRAINDRLKQCGYETVSIYREQCNLLNYERTREIFDHIRPGYCIHAAGYNGNLDFNHKFPAEVFHKTAQIGLNVLKCCNEVKVKKVLNLISSCAYPDIPDGILREQDFWFGLPHTSVDAHGLSKRILHAYSLQLHKQYDLISICVILNTCFGPYDNYNLEKTKVVGALIKRFVDAKVNNLPHVECRGSGHVKREFIYCKDAANYVVQALESYNDVNEPLNLATGQELEIRTLVENIRSLVSYHGLVKWDGRPDGQQRKYLDRTKMHKCIRDLSFTELSAALTETINWYKKNYFSNS